MNSVFFYIGRFLFELEEEIDLQTILNLHGFRTT